MIRRPPRSTLFPSRRSSDLPLWGGHDQRGDAQDPRRWRARLPEETLSAARRRVARPHLCRMLPAGRSEEHTSELQSHSDLVCRLLLEKKKIDINSLHTYKPL